MSHRLLARHPRPRERVVGGWPVVGSVAMHRIEVERTFPHSVERVFRRYTDHVGWSDWAGLGKVRLVHGGSPDRNGVGAVRAFAVAPGLREEVVRFDPPADDRASARMDYRVVAGPIPMKDHLGEVTFVPEGEGTRLTWRVSFSKTLPGLGGAVERALTMLFRRMLAGFARDLDRRRS